MDNSTMDPNASSFTPMDRINAAASAIGDRFTSATAPSSNGSSPIDGIITQMNQNLDQVVSEFTSQNDILSNTQSEIMKAVEMIIGLSNNLSKATNDTTIKKLSEQLSTQQSKLSNLNSQLGTNMKMSQTILEKMNSASNGGIGGGRKSMRGGWAWDDAPKSSSRRNSSNRNSSNRNSSNRNSSKRTTGRHSKTRNSSGGGKRGKRRTRKR
jgi:hypothetical protein